MKGEMMTSRAADSRMTVFKNALFSESTKSYLKSVLPATVSKYLTPERMGRVALATISKTPDLWACRPESIVRAIVDAASVGLEPTGGVLAHGYLVPYKDQCQFIIGYQGLVELARRSGNFEHLEANAVFEKDTLVLRYGFNADFSHEPYMGTGDRGNMIGAYCLALFKGGERHVTYMTKSDIEKRRSASKSGQKGPWRDWYEEMAIKTVIKKAAKLWPKTVEITAAMDMEERGDDAPLSLLDASFAEPPLPKPSRGDDVLAKLDANPGATITDDEFDAAADAVVKNPLRGTRAVEEIIDEPAPWEKYQKAEGDDD